MVTTADLAPRLLPSMSTWPTCRAARHSNQWQSMAIGDHQWPISGNQWPTCREPVIPISGNPWQPVAIRGNQ
jgi:hypothetical protein